MRLDILLAAGALMLASAAQASEVTTYEYDALGRLVKPAEFGEPIFGLQKTTVFGPAENRRNQTAAGSTDIETISPRPSLAS